MRCPSQIVFANEDFKIREGTFTSEKFFDWNDGRAFELLRNYSRVIVIGRFSCKIVNTHGDVKEPYQMTSEELISARISES
jgi:hypothetical protein